MILYRSSLKSAVVNLKRFDKQILIQISDRCLREHCRWSHLWIWKQKGCKEEGFSTIWHPQNLFLLLAYFHGWISLFLEKCAGSLLASSFIISVQEEDDPTLINRQKKN